MSCAPVSVMMSDYQSDRPSTYIFDSLKELLADNETNQFIEGALQRTFKNEIDTYMQEFDYNVGFLFVIIESCFAGQSVNERKLKQRTPLMGKFMLWQECALTALEFLSYIAKLCHQSGLPLEEIDKVVDILYADNVITEYTRNHWAMAKTADGKDADTEYRIGLIDLCIDFKQRLLVSDQTDDYDSVDDSQ